jgi:hypothetical protein
MLSEIQAMMTEMAMKGGFAYSRWKEGLSVMIPKTPGARTANKLRAILLFEGDFNWANKVIFSDRMVKRAQPAGVIPLEQYAQHESSAIDVAFMGMLHCDFLRLRRWAGGIASVDAKKLRQSRTPVFNPS